jgi:hypothetical protein
VVWFLVCLLFEFDVWSCYPVLMVVWAINQLLIAGEEFMEMLGK